MEFSLPWLYMLLPFTVFAEWQYDSGLWYYFSNTHDRQNYTNAMGSCQALGAHLVTITNWDQYHMIANRTSEPTWIGLSTLKNNHTGYCKDKILVWSRDYSCKNYFNVYRIRELIRRIPNPTCSVCVITENSIFDIKTCGNIFGYVCQWQCHNVQVYTGSTDYQNIEGLYIQGPYHGGRKQYINVSLQSDSKAYLRYDQPLWKFLKDGTLVLKSVTSQTLLVPSMVPYSKTHVWYGLSNNKQRIDFVCVDCIVYLVELLDSQSHVLVHDMLFMDTKGKMIVYHSQSGDTTWTYDRQTFNWCITTDIISSQICVGHDSLSLPVDIQFKLNNSLYSVFLQCKSIDPRDRITTYDESTSRPSTSTKYDPEDGKSHAEHMTSTVGTNAITTVNDNTTSARHANSSTLHESIIFIVVISIIRIAVVLAIIVTAVLILRKRQKNKSSTDHIGRVNHNTTEINIYTTDPVRTTRQHGQSDAPPTPTAPPVE